MGSIINGSKWAVYNSTAPNAYMTKVRTFATKSEAMKFAAELRKREKQRTGRRHVQVGVGLNRK